MFGQISGSPSDRNLINFYWDGGVVFSGMVANRPDDKFGATVIYAQISDRDRGLDHDTVAFSGMPYPIRDFELTLEFTYQAQIRPGWTFQPNLQFIFHPGGHVPVPGATSLAPVKDATVIGARHHLLKRLNAPPVWPGRLDLGQRRRFMRGRDIGQEQPRKDVNHQQAADRR